MEEKTAIESKRTIIFFLKRRKYFFRPSADCLIERVSAAASHVRYRLAADGVKPKFSKKHF